MPFLLNKSINSISISGWILALSAIVSAFMGLFRNRLLLDVYGVSIETDIYNLAFRIPDLAYTLTLSGAISAAVIPVLASKISTNREEVYRIIQSFFFVALIFVSILCLILFIVMPYAIDGIAPGFDESSRSKAIAISRIMLLSPILLGVSAVFSSVLQSLRKFIIYAMVPIFYNIGLIIGIVFFTDIWGLNGLAYGVILGAFLHLAIQVPSLISAGFSFKKSRKFFHPELSKIAKLMGPRSFASSVYQINLIAITALASVIGTGSITIFMNSYNINLLLVGILGVSFATAMFPSLSAAYARKDYKKYLFYFSSTFKGVLFLLIPASILFFILRYQITMLAYGVSNVSLGDLKLMATSLGILSIGGFTYALFPIVARAFYARQNTITPVSASVIGVASNIAIIVILLYVIFPATSIVESIEKLFNIQGLRLTDTVSLPIAFSLSGILSLLVLFTMFVFTDSRNRVLIYDIGKSFIKICSVGFVSGAIGWITLNFVFEKVESDLSAIFIQTAVVGTIVSIFYIGCAYIFKFSELKFLRVRFSKHNE